VLQLFDLPSCHAATQPFARLVVANFGSLIDHLLVIMASLDDDSDHSQTVPRVPRHQPRHVEAQAPAADANEGIWLEDLRRSPSRRTEVDTPPKQLTARDGFVLLINIQIGSGIFTSPSQVNSNVSSPALALVCWLLGGLLAWTGALSFAELGANLPGRGGMQEYLQYVYGDTAAFSMAWMWMIIVKPTAMAILSIVLVESIAAGIGTANSASVLQSLITMLVFLVVIWLNCFSSAFRTRMSETLVFVKISTVGFVTLCGLFVVFRHYFIGDPEQEESTDWYKNNWLSPRPDTFSWPDMSFSEAFGHFCAAVYGSLWSYGGWENVS
jgi:solute carrier family 7 (L-type amino acid transporter), member 9/15